MKIMRENNQTTDKEIVLPEEITSIIYNILEKYGLAESHAEILAKSSKGKEINGAIVANLIKKITDREIGFQELISSLRVEFNLTKKGAEDLARDIEERILSQVTRPSETVPRPTEERGLELKERPSGEKPPRPITDIYRELVE